MARTPKTRWKTWVAVAAFVIVLVLCGWIYLRFRGPGKKIADPLAGFTIMNLPRRDVDIGAVWTEGVGPIRGSTGVPKLQTRSLDAGEIKTIENVDASIVGNLASRLSVGASGSNEAQRTTQLKGLTIVTVADASTLSSIAGNEYLWEAVRADSFSVVVSQSTKAEARAKIQGASDADSIEEKSNGTDSVELTANGSKLYVAYRVVKIAQPTQDTVDSTTLTAPSSDVNLGTEYALHFAPSHKGETMFSKNCEVNITVTSYLVLDQQGHGTQSTPVKVHCGATQSLTYPVASTSGSERAVIDSLQIANLKMGLGEGGPALATGTFAIERRKLKLESVEKPSAAGW